MFEARVRKPRILNEGGKLIFFLTKQAWKTILLAGMYGVWMAYDALVGSVTLWAGAASLLAWAIITYSAVFPGAVADVIQSQAQVSYATLPSFPLNFTRCTLCVG